MIGCFFSISLFLSWLAKSIESWLLTSSEGMNVVHILWLGYWFNWQAACEQWKPERADEVDSVQINESRMRRKSRDLPILEFVIFSFKGQTDFHDEDLELLK